MTQRRGFRPGHSRAGGNPVLIVVKSKRVELNETEMEAWAKDLACEIKAPQVICLWGDLGAGKSTFARALIRHLMHNPELNVPSPTFTLVQTYVVGVGEIWHADLYRLKSSDEVENIGLLEAFYQHICLVEWPCRLENDLPAHRWDIEFIHQNTSARHIKLTKY